MKLRAWTETKNRSSSPIAQGPELTEFDIQDVRRIFVKHQDICIEVLSGKKYLVEKGEIEVVQ